MGTHLACKMGPNPVKHRQKLDAEMFEQGNRILFFIFPDAD
jgi:hypothetical protein